ncbi:MAG: methyl-accepting chemotaxis protein [Myxococcota bacterium]
MTTLVAGFALFLVLFFPARMEEFSRRWVERRAVGVASVLATVAATALEFDDANSVNELLGGLATSEVLYAVVRKDDGTTFAGFRKERAPATVATPGVEPTLTYSNDELRLDARLKAKGGATGTLTIGYSLAELNREVAANRAVVGGASLVVFLIGLLVSFLVGTLLIRPIQHMTQVALRIAAGDLSQTELTQYGGDEAGQLAAAFNRMLHALRQLAAAADRMARGDLSGRLDMEGQVAEAFNRMLDAQRSVVSEISSTSVQLAAAAAQIFAAAQDQEGAATRQSAGVEEVSQTMQSLLQSAAHIAESARGVLQNAERSKETTEATSAKIGELSGHTNRIAELLDVIRDIADRSDLLALNASLEATRAGEAGRAFALVAGEMRRLAERVTATVGDVKSLVSDIRASGAATVMTTEEARKLADSTTESARQITLVTQQQRTGTEQVSHSMREISVLLGQYASGTQQTRSLAEGLKSQAEKLEHVVGKYALGVRPGGARESS